MTLYNRMTVFGELADDPEVRYLPDKTPIVKGRIKTGNEWQNKEGEWKTRSCFLDFEGFGKFTFDKIGHLKKGAKVRMEGGMDSESFEGRDGQKRYKLVYKIREAELQRTSSPKPAEPQYDYSPADAEPPF